MLANVVRNASCTSPRCSSDNGSRGCFCHIPHVSDWHRQKFRPTVRAKLKESYDQCELRQTSVVRRYREIIAVERHGFSIRDQGRIYFVPSDLSRFPQVPLRSARNRLGLPGEMGSESARLFTRVDPAGALQQYI